MRDLHARLSDVHAFSVILETRSMFCALCGMLHYSASSTPCVDLTSTRSILRNTSVRRCMRKIDSSLCDLFNEVPVRFCVV